MADTFRAAAVVDALRSRVYDARRGEHRTAVVPRVVSLRRHNLAKRAVSSLKGDCWARDLQNHATATDVLNVSTPTYLLVDPRLFLLEALNSARHQQRLTRWFPKPTHATSYEELQTDPEGAMQRLFVALGLDVAAPSLEHAQPPQAGVSTHKSAHEDLARLLVNFDEVSNATARQWPCLLPQLRSVRPQHWEPCHPQTWPSHVPRVPGAGRAVVVSCARKTCQGTSRGRWLVPWHAPPGAARCFAAAHVGEELCARALAHARRQRPGATAANLCVRTADSRDNADESWLTRYGASVAAG